jgi:hypothetical protein
MAMTRTIPGILWLALAAAFACAQTPKLEPLPLSLPKPLFEGTPQNFKAPNLERPTGKMRPAFLAPSGTLNVARGKPVSSSASETSVGEFEMLTDGEKSGLDGTYVELPPGIQSVTIDLKERCTIYAIALWHFHKQARVYFDVIVQVTDDPDFLTNVRTLFNNDHDNTAGLGAGKDLNYVETAEGRLIDAKGVIARYVRLWSNGNNINALNHYVEVEVYGKPAH